MLSFSKDSIFLWAEAVATTCCTQNRFIIHTLHDKTSYELVHDKKPDLLFLRVFSALCYPTNDGEVIGKLKAKADIGLFVGYAPNRKGYQIYNKCTRQIIETIHVTFNEFTGQTDPVQTSLGSAPNILTLGPISLGLVPNPAPAIPYVPPTKKKLEIFFQPTFDEYFDPSTVDQQVPLALAVYIPVNPPCLSVSISVDQDAPSEDTAMALTSYADADYAGNQDTRRSTSRSAQFLDDKAFTASFTILAIYIQQFWDTMCFDSSTGLYSSQLDKQWFNLHKDILKDALDITPTNDNNPFGDPPSSDTVVEYVNTLGYPCMLRNMSAMSVNVLYQPWRAILSMINMCLTEFVQSIQTFLTDKKNLTTASRGKKKSSHLLIPGVREIFGMPIPDALLTNAIKRAPYYSGYLEHVVEYQRYMDEEHDKAEEKQVVTDSPNATKVTKPKAAKQTKPSAPKKDQGNKHKLVKEASDTPFYAKRSKASKVTKKRMPKSPLQLVDEFVDEGVPRKEHAYDDEEANLQRALELNEVTEINIGDQDEGQARPNLDLEATDASSQQNPEQMDEEFTTTAYLNVQENLKLPTKDQEKEPEKTNIESEVQLMVMVPIHQDTSSVPPMTTPVINVTVSQPVSTTVQASLPTSTTIATTITTTTTLPPPPPHTQQSTTDSILLQCIAKLEKHMADLLQNNFALEERLDQHGSWLYNLENLNIPQQEILQQRMFEDKSYEAHKDHKKLFDALQKSLEHDYSNQLLLDLEAARQKKRKRHDLPRTPFRSPPSQPPPPPPSAGASEASESSPTNYMMNDDSIHDEHVQFSDDEDTGNDHLPKADTRKDLWKPLPEEERPRIPEPSWIIPSSDVSDIENNWAFVLVLTCKPHAENLLLAKISDMTAFLNWYYQKMNKTMLTQEYFIGKGYEVVKAFYPNDLDYLRYGNKGIRPALSISKMKATHYPDFGLELLMLEQLHDSSSRQKEVRTHMRILSVVSIIVKIRSYKDGKVRYAFPRSYQSRRDLPKDNPLVSVEVLK
nr:retrovirus-related Pol polyprotein from transposon TNT 1-94 [Tanacetum cinerariifolium]